MLLPIIKVRNTGSVLFTLGVLCALLYLGRLLLVTLLVGVFIAFILEPLVQFFMRLRLPRGFASFLVCGLALLVMYLGALLAFSQAQGLWDELPSYTRRVNDLSDKVLMEVESAEKTVNDMLAPKRVREMEAQRLERERLLVEQQKQRRRRTTDPPMSPLLPPAVQEVRIRPERSPLVEYLYSNWQQFYDIALMVSFVPFLVYFMLAWRDHFIYNFLRVFEGDARSIASATIDGIARMTRAYVVGNFLLGMVLAVVSTGFFWMVKVPYWLLVGPISGFLSLVPYIGLPLAILPPVFAALTVYQNLTAYVVIGSTVAFFHLMALNLLYPKLVGARVHLNPLVVTVALMFWGFLWGGIGLVLAIPLTAALKAVCDHYPGLGAYGKLMGD
ncbi:MAG: AI-2E family transporter [Acidobacteria bacterium]|nr:AI-2E family transporter [Bryobacteraceae bacterium CoA2 C42]MCA2966110.1 AI-2E family transporter [Acidobacteriaceae bacterium]